MDFKRKKKKKKQRKGATSTIRPWREARGFSLTVAIGLVGLSGVGVVLVLRANLLKAFDVWPDSEREDLAIVPPHPHRFSTTGLHFRFPTIDERVRYYMGSWYNNSISEKAPLCDDVPYYQNAGNGSTCGFVFDKQYLFDENNLINITGVEHYAEDARGYYIAVAPKGSRFVMSFGDTEPLKDDYPMMVKAREVTGFKRAGKPDAIIAHINIRRHFESVVDLQQRQHQASDIPAWAEKKDTLIWRGAAHENRLRWKAVDLFLGEDRGFIDIGFTDVFDVGVRDMHRSKKCEMMMRKNMTIDDMLHYKYLLSLEGNDVASGLKWMLYSNSVVFMPPPTYVSWAMEDKLVPFYHYIPVRRDFSDLKDVLRWARANDEIVQSISHHATEYIENLFASKQAKLTNQEIIRRITQRYYELYGPDLSKCSGHESFSLRNESTVSCPPSTKKPSIVVDLETYNDYDWVELPRNVQNAAEQAGFDQRKWDVEESDEDDCF